MANLATTKDGKKLMIVESAPDKVTEIVRGLVEGLEENSRVERHQIPSEHLIILDKFVAKVMNVGDCQVLSYEGCNSCCADGISSSIAHTTCGDFCHEVCGSEPCH